MDDKEKLEIWKRKLIELEDKVRRLSNEKNILTNIFNEVKTNQNIKLSISLKDMELEDEISHLKGWIKFNEEKISRYKNNIEKLGEEVSEQEFERIKEEAKLKELLEEKEEVKEGIKSASEEKPEKEEKQTLMEEAEEFAEFKPQEKEKPLINVEEDEVRKQVKELFEGRKAIKYRLKENLMAVKKPIENIFEKATRLYTNKLVRYGVPIVLCLLVISVLFVSKPEITGYVTLTQEETYDDNLNLIMNESGNYTWTPSNIGNIQSIKATGRVKGNGAVKVYIEKDGERYLIFDSKRVNE